MQTSIADTSKKRFAGRKKTPLMILSAAIVAMLVLTGMAAMMTPETSAVDDTQTVTYHSNGTGDPDVSVTYLGIVATEYNPLYWAGTFTGCPGNWTAPTMDHDYGGTVGTVMSVHKVFAGWIVGRDTPISAADIIDPGDVIPADVHDLYAYWAFPDIFRVNNVNYEYRPASATGTQATPTATGGTPYADSMYTRQYSISGTLNFATSSNILTTGSYRSLSAYGESGNGTFNINGNVSASGNVLIDNVTLTSRSIGGNHGYGTSAGLFGNGHKLILGAGISNAANYTVETAPQVFGGGTGNTTSAAVSNKSIVSKDPDLASMDPLNMGSFVIIHSGVYSNLMGGGRQNMGSATNPLSTYVVCKSCTVLDSVGGGHTNATSGYTIYGASNHNTLDPYQGGTFVYAIGLTTLGDSWASQETGYTQSVVTNEGTNFQGGASKGDVKGSTHVFVSGSSSVWDVQGGGRAGYTVCDFTYVEISGEAEVRHAACGLVTDGNSDNSNITCAKGTKILVADNPKIAMLFGAGYDTWANPRYSNMTLGKSIEVEIRGGTIGFVYGGGYRGTVGSNNNDLTIDVSITGGTVLYDVFGGGRGGVDKMLRTTSGKDPSGNGYTNSTGQSVVWGDINVTIGGTAEILGNVYGGGESVPMLTRYYGTVFSTNDTSVNVAMVNGNTSVTVTGDATVKGGVYGSGKGIGVENGAVISTYDPVTGEDVAHYYTKNLVLSKKAGDGGWRFLDWYNHSSEGYSIIYDNNSLTKYQEYAKTSENATVTIEGGSVGTYAKAGNVYGGGAFSKTETDSSVTITGGNIIGDVYGGGLGTVDLNSVLGNSKVTITGGDISKDENDNGGSVYGGSAYGITVKNASASISHGTIWGNLFGGGLGIMEHNSVLQKSSATVSGDAVVKGSVYGGSAYGISVAEARATITGGRVGGNVFAGGLGTPTVVSVKGKRYILIDGGTVDGSVYAGSSLGDDASSKAAMDAGNREEGLSAYVYVTAGKIEGSVYGGGYKGCTTGTTYMYVGYDADGNKTNERSIFIGNSIYGGGDVGELEPGQPMFKDTMVYGGSEVRVNGKNDITFTGTISAAGNSCLTKGDTEILVEDLVLSDEIESVHRANTVTIVSSNLKLTGKINGSGDNTKYSFYGIDQLNLKSSMSSVPPYKQVGSTIHLYAPLNEVGEYNSLNSTDGYTKGSAPMNTVYICNGTMFEVMQTKNSNAVYGDINGYTLLALKTVEDYYGAVTLGAKTSTGGFVVEYDGSYKEADMTDFDNCRCWFISGSLQTVSASTLLYSTAPGTDYINDGGQYLTIPTLSKTTIIRYTGGFFTSDLGCTLVQNNNPASGQFAVELGTNSKGAVNAMTLPGTANKFLPNNYDITDIPGETMENRTEQPLLEITAYGHNDNANRYVGYAMIYLQEVVEVKYYSGTELKTDFLVQNRIEVRLDIYTEGNASTVPDQTIGIQTIDGEGYADILIPSQLSDYTVYMTHADKLCDGTFVTVSSVKNNGGTTGWNYPLHTIDVSNGFDGMERMQSLTGAFMATLRISVSNFTSDDEMDASLTFQIWDPDNSSCSEFTVTIKVEKHPQVLVVFHDAERGLIKEYNLDYGKIIRESDCPPTVDYFVGWYTDSDFINQYNFNTPLYNDIELFARYMYRVTFDYQNGITSVLYIDKNSTDTTLQAPPDPAWDGYSFEGWFQEAACQNSWTFAGSPSPDVVNDNVTLYAKWLGDLYHVTFQYTLNGQTAYIMDGDEPLGFDVRFGGVFGNGINTATSKMLDILEEKHSDYLFVRWQFATGTSTVGVYADTICRPTGGGSTVVLVADFAKDAVYINLNKNAGADDANTTIEAPTNFLLYADDQGWYTFVGNNATRSGWRIIGWGFDTSNTDYIDIGTDYPFKKTDVTLVDNTLQLYAVWEQIEYTITLEQPMGGKIWATIQGEEGTFYDEFTVTYGKTINLYFSDESGSYQFSEWKLKGGQGEFLKITEDPAEVPSKNNPANMKVIGSCAINAQLMPLNTVTINLYLNGGTDADDQTAIDLRLYDKNSTYLAQLRAGSEVLTDGDGKYYRQYTGSSKLGTFNITILGTDKVRYNIGTLFVNSDPTEADAFAVTVSSSVDPALTGLPMFAALGDTFRFGLPEGYEIDAKLHVKVNGATSDLDALEYTVPAAVTSGIEISGDLRMIVWTVIFDPITDFTFKIGENVVLNATYDYWESPGVRSVFGTLPDVYDSSGVRVGSDLSPYLFEYWAYDSGLNREIHSDDIVRSDDTVNHIVRIYAYLYERDSVQYTLQVFVDGFDGQYPDTATYSTVRHGGDGQHLTVELSSLASLDELLFTGIQINQTKSVDMSGGAISFTGDSFEFDLADGMVISLYFDRLTYANAEIAVGDATPVSTPEGWTYDSANNKFTKALVYFGESVTLPLLEREGYTHRGWTVGSETVGTTATVTFTTVTAGSLEFPAVSSIVEINTWTLTLKANDWRIKFSDASVEKTLANVPFGTTVSGVSGFEQPADIPGFVTFVKWIDESTKQEFDVSGGMPDRNLTLLATWDVAKFTVTFSGINASGDGEADAIVVSGRSNGENFVSGDSVEYGVIEVSVQINAHHRFSTYTVTDGTDGVLYTETEGHQYTFRVTLNKDIEITFECQESKFRVIYYLDSVQVYDEMLYEGTQITKTVPYEFERIGYLLKGDTWYVNAAMTEAADYIKLAYLSNDWTFYGESQAKVYTVSFEGNGATGGSTASVEMTFDQAKALAPNGFTKEGAIFFGWSLPDTAEARYGNGESVTNVSTTGDDITLTAVWLTVTDYVGCYDGAKHMPVVSAPGAVAYFSESVELDDGNYSTEGSSAVTGYKDAGNYSWYYYVKGTYVSYSSGSDTVHSTISKTALNVIADNVTIFYGDDPTAAFTVTLQGIKGSDTLADLGGTLVYDCEYSQFDNVGTFPITIGEHSTLTSANYEISYTDGGILTVERKVVSLVWSDLTPMYTASAQEPTVNAVGLVNGDNCTFTLTLDREAIFVGTYIATINDWQFVGGNAKNYLLPEERQTTFEIIKRTLTVTGITANGKVYDRSLTADYDISGATLVGVQGTDSLTFSKEGVQMQFEDRYAGVDKRIVVVDGHGFTVTGERMANYELVQPVLTATITPVAITLESGSDEKVYDGTPLSNSNVYIRSGAMVQSEVFEYTFLNTQTERGSVANEFTAGPDDVARNYDITYIYGTLKVTGKQIKNITYSVYTDMPYDKAAHAILNSYSATTEEGSATWKFRADPGDEWSSTMITVTNVAQSGTYYYQIYGGESYDTVEGSFTVTITPKIVTAPTVAGSVYDGHKYVPAVAASEWYSVKSNAGGTDAGNYEVILTLTDAANSDWSDVATDDKTIVYTISKANSSVIVSSILNLTYNADPQTLITVQGLVGGTIEFSLNGGGYAADIPAGTDAGVYTISWKITPDANHKELNGNLQTEIHKADPSLVGQANILIYNAAAQELLTVTAPAGVTVLYSTDNVSFAAAIPTGTDAGSYTVYYKCDATANYNAVTQALSMTVSIQQAPFSTLGIKFESKTVPYTGDLKTITITGSLPDGITVSYDNNTGTDAGVYEATATFSGAKIGNYSGVETMHATLYIVVVDIDFEVVVYNKVYDGYPHAAIELSSNTDDVEFWYSLTQYGTYTNECPQITDAGELTVWFRITAPNHTTVEGSDCYRTAKVSAIDLTVSSKTTSKVYDGTELRDEDITVTGDILAGHRAVATFKNTSRITNAGSVTNAFEVKIYNSSDEDVSHNYALNKSQGILTVNKRNVSIVIQPYTAEYDGTTPVQPVSFVGLAPGDEMYAVLRYTEINSPVNVGTYHPYVWGFGIPGKDANYEVTFNDESHPSDAVLEITPRIVTAPAEDDTEFVYNGLQQTYMVAANPGLYTISGNRHDDAGDYIVSVRLNDKTNSAWKTTGSSDDLQYSFIIKKKDLSITADKITITWGEQDTTVYTYVITGSVTGSPGVSGQLEPATTEIGMNDMTIGTLTLYNNGAFKLSNYEVTFFGTECLEIRPFLVSLPALPGNGGILTWTGELIVAYEDTEYYTVTGGSATDVGEYSATLTLRDKVHYLWSVEPRTSDDQTRMFWIELPAINIVYVPYRGTYDGQFHDAFTLVDADGATVTIIIDAVEQTGFTIPKVKDASDTREIVIKAEKPNHKVFYEVVEFKIDKAVLNITADSFVILQSENVPAFTFSTDGFIGSEGLNDLDCGIAFETSYVKGGAWGKYAISVVGTPVDGNYEIVIHEGVLTVALHKVKLIWSNTSYTYTGGVIPIGVTMEDETGAWTNCNATVTDLKGNAKEFREVGEYIATAVLPDGYALDPAWNGGLTQNVSIVKSGSFELNPWIWIAILILVISTIAVYYWFGYKKKKA